MTEEKKIDKKELVKEQLKHLTDIEDSMKMENVVKDNKVEFKSGKDIYRVRLPEFSERNEIQQEKKLKYLELIKDEKTLFRKQWVDLYKKKGIDIDKMEDNIKRKQNEIKSLLLRLAKITDINSIKTIKDNIQKLRNEQYNLVIEKTDLLQYSIEDQLLIYVNSYTAYLVLERKEEDKWIRHFDIYKNFEKCEDFDLMGKVFEYISHLI